MPAGGAGAREADLATGDNSAKARGVPGSQARRLARRQPGGFSGGVASSIPGRGQQSV
jgi:hypothetical protein